MWSICMYCVSVYILYMYIFVRVYTFVCLWMYIYLHRCTYYALFHPALLCWFCLFPVQPLVTYVCL